MAAFLGFILAMTLIVAAGPAVGLLLGVAFAGMWLWLGEKLENVFRQEPARKADGVNLPEQLLSTRRRPFRVETHEGTLERVYLIPAKHAGAATMKARRWGVKVERVTEVRAVES